MYPPNQKAPGATIDDVLLLLFRLGVATVLIIFQLAPQAPVGWEAIWQETGWPLADAATGFGVPHAKWMVACAMVLASLSALGVACGFVTRLSCVALLVGTALLGYSAVVEADVVTLELALLYVCILLFLLLRGPGYLSADGHISRSAS